LNESRRPEEHGPGGRHSPSWAHVEDEAGSGRTSTHKVAFTLTLTPHDAARPRGRFDAAHELGHLVMHGHERPLPGPEAEREANQFASAFLMPRADVVA
jgi:hypothetical protein